MTSNITLEDFETKAKKWLDENAQKKPETSKKEAEWGEGEFSVAVFHNLTFEEERDLLQEAAAWQISKAEHGYHAITWPAEYGGLDLPIEYARAFASLESGYITPSRHETFSVTTRLIAPTVLHYGTEDQKNELLSDLFSAKIFCCQLFSEPGTVSDLAGLGCKAVKDGDDWIINGNKMWITNGSIADVALVWAKDENSIIRGFLIEKGTKGFSSNDLHGKFSLRASITSELSMSDVRVPDSSRLPNIEGLKGPLSCLTQARYGIAWGMVGAAVDCYNTALNYAKERKQFSKPIAGYQLTQQKIAEMVTQITESQLLVYRLGRLKDENKMTFQQVSLAKRNNCVMAREIAKTAREMLGGNGIIIDYSPIRHMANIESVFTYEGTHEMHTLIIGEHETGIAAYDS